MKIRLIGNVKTIMSNPDGDHKYFGWPTITRLKNGRIAVGASGYRVEHDCPFGKGVVAYSDDEGESYTAPKAIIDTVLDDRDVGLTAFGDSGLIVTSFNNTTAFQRDNMPQTKECFDYIDSVDPDEEEKSLGCTFRISYDNGESFSKIYKSPVTSPHGPIVLNNGKILWIGTVYGANERVEIYELNPENGDMTFVSEIKSELYLDEPHAIQLPDGRIVCHFRIEDEKRGIFTLLQTVSFDEGKSWSAPKQIIGDDSGAPAHLFRHSSGLLISTFGRRSYVCGIRAIISRDNGESWGEEYIIYENPDTDDDLGYPSTIELHDGTLLTAFYSKDTEDAPAVIMQQKWCIEDI